MQKWFISVIIIMVMLIVLPACSSGTSSSTTTTGTTSQPTATSTSTSTSNPTTTTSTSKPTATTSTSTGGPVYGGKFTMVRNGGLSKIGAPSDIPTETNYYSLAASVIETLFIVDAADKIVPTLAESVDVAADGLSITFKLRKGVKFHDGTDFNAAAVKYNLETVKAAKVSGGAVLDLVTSYDIIDDFTIKANLKSFDATFLMSLAQLGIGHMVSPTALAKPTTPENAGKDHLVGTGPFMFDSWSIDQYFRMKKNPNYWQPGRPYLDMIEHRNMPDTTTSVISFKAGEVDMVENIDPAQYNELKSQGFTVGIPEGLAYVFSIRTANKDPNSPFSKKEVREALWYSIDRKSMVEGLYKGTAGVADQLSAPMQGWYIKDYPNRSYDPIKAKMLLNQAGYPDGIKTVLHGDTRGRQDDLIALQNYFRVIGIETTLDMADPGRSSTFATQGFDGIFQRGFPNWSSFSSWVQVWIDPVQTYPTMQFPDGWSASWTKVRTEPDYDKRMAMMQDLLKVVYDEALVIPWMWDSPRYVISSKIHDMKWDAVDIGGYFDPVNMWKSK
jgi:peptide/nickel transport system substrate-binding protein